ncbi:hypothetical protein MMC21_003886 [Puttea exsequens]|nr:hypothetical protein [Puttea exsequens]
MTSHLSNGATDGAIKGAQDEVSLQELPKSNIFTSNLPPDDAFKTPSDSHKAPRANLGPRMVKGAIYTYVRPEQTEDPELLGISRTAMRDIGLIDGQEKTEEFRNTVAGNRIYWDEKTSEGIYPWAQCYGGYQFGSWAGQLGDGRAISLFESTNPATKARYEIQLKGAGRTPYSRFADGKAVLRSSIREFIVSEALNGLHIPTTRALSLTLAPKSKVRRERLEPGAIVTRFAQSWLRIGTFDLMRARGDRKLVRTLADYVAEHVYPGWDSLPAALQEPSKPTAAEPSTGIPADRIQGAEGVEENRYTRLYRAICRKNALTVAAWQAYAFTNGVLNTDNTSLLGLSLDFGPFAFLDNFDPSYTPNHDDHALRYSYKNQPSIMWWNLVRLGEAFGELIGAGAQVDDTDVLEKVVSEAFAPELIKRAETVIGNVGEEYRAVFLAEYSSLMRARLGLVSEKSSDFGELFSELLDTLEALELDFNHFFRRLSSVRISELETEDSRKEKASIFFHAEGITATSGVSESAARERVGAWLSKWGTRVREDWGSDRDGEREKQMKRVNPKFVPRSWVLDEIIDRVEHKGERDVLKIVMTMAEHPFEEEWGGDKEEEKRWCGDVPRHGRMMQCSCSS